MYAHVSFCLHRLVTKNRAAPVFTGTFYLGNSIAMVPTLAPMQMRAVAVVLMINGAELR